MTTPEKWDSVTRHWRDKQSLMSSIRLVLIDEVHMLNEARGATLEVVVSRMKTLNGEMERAASAPGSRSDSVPLRFVAVSATVPNVRDIAEWLGTGCDSGDRAITFEFGEEYRPVPLQRHVLAFPMNDKQNAFTFENSLNFKYGTLSGDYCGGSMPCADCRRSLTSTRMESRRSL